MVNLKSGIAGNNEAALVSALHNVDDQTRLITFSPRKLSLCSVFKEKMVGEKKILFAVKLNPWQLKSSSLLFDPRSNGQNSILRRKENLARLVEGTMGLNAEDLHEISDNGFYFEFKDQDSNPIVLIPEGRFMETMCRLLKIGKLDEGGVSSCARTLPRDLYLASLMQRVEREIGAIVRMSGKGVGRIICTVSPKYRFEKQSDALDVIDKIRAEYDLSLLNFIIDKRKTVINYKINNFAPLFDGGEIGFQYLFSDTGAYANVIHPAIFTDGCPAYVGAGFSVRHILQQEQESLPDLFLEKGIKDLKRAQSVFNNGTEEVNLSEAIKAKADSLNLYYHMGKKRYEAFIAKNGEPSPAISDYFDGRETGALNEAYAYLLSIPSVFEGKFDAREKAAKCLSPLLIH